MKRDTQMPGEAKLDPKTGLPPALNNSDADPNDVARSRERVLQATAIAATGGEGEIAPAPELDTGPAMRTAKLGGENVRVQIPAVRRNPHVVKYGPESRHPNGTPVDEKGNPIEGDAQPWGIVGNIETPQGLLVNRIIPLDSLDEPVDTVGRAA